MSSSLEKKVNYILKKINEAISGVKIIDLQDYINNDGDAYFVVSLTNGNDKRLSYQGLKDYIAQEILSSSGDYDVVIKQWIVNKISEYDITIKEYITSEFTGYDATIKQYITNQFESYDTTIKNYITNYVNGKITNYDGLIKQYIEQNVFDYFRLATKVFIKNDNTISELNTSNIIDKISSFNDLTDFGDENSLPFMVMHKAGYIRNILVKGVPEQDDNDINFGVIAVKVEYHDNDNPPTINKIAISDFTVTPLQLKNGRSIQLGAGLEIPKDYNILIGATQSITGESAWLNNVSYSLQIEYKKILPQ